MMSLSDSETWSSPIRLFFFAAAARAMVMCFQVRSTLDRAAFSAKSEVSPAQVLAYLGGENGLYHQKSITKTVSGAVTRWVTFGM